MKNIIFAVLVIIIGVIWLKTASSFDEIRNNEWSTKLDNCRSLGAEYDLTANGCVKVDYSL